jgi:TonB-linked SusC/RagA family outer membrane protein
MKKGLLFLLLFLPFLLFAQQQYQGIVVDSATGQAISGASVTITGSSKGASTNIDGSFTLSAENGSQLQISSLGYNSQVYTLGGELNFVIRLSPSTTNELAQVVVVGYGTQRKIDLTAPIAVVNARDLSKQTTSNAMSALAGSVAGVQVTNNNGGQPGASPTVLIRGLGSISTTGAPLYVVDGMFYTDINFLNTGDIESITILKDASAAAIYGVKAANGVVLITTKKGSLNTRARITYDGYIGIQTAANILKMANTQQYSNYMLAKGNTSDSAIIANSIARYGGNGNLPSTNTNWYSELLRSALIHNHSLDISGGTEKSTYSLGVDYTYQNGIMNTDLNNFKRINIRGKADYQATDWLKIGFSMIVSNTSLYSPNNAAWFYAYAAPSVFPVFDPKNTNATPKDYADAGAIGLDNGHIQNPMALADYYNNYTSGFQVLPSAYFDINFWKNKLVWHTQFNESFALNSLRQYTPVYFVGSNQQNAISSLLKETDEFNNYVLDNTLTYKDRFGKHNLSVMLGNSVRSEKWQMLQGTAKNTPGNTQSMYLDQGDPTTLGTTDNGSLYNGLSFFARAAYDYASKYMATVTFRADASSKYPYQPWGYFPSVGLGWVISNEDWMKNQQIFSFLKLRGSWGLIGNDNVPRGGYSIVSTNGGTSAIFGDNNMVQGFQTTGFFNPLIWEKTGEWDVGLDMNFLLNRLTTTWDWYRRTTTNGVFTALIPNTNIPETGNFANILNTGFEATVQWKDKVGAFNYWVGGNLSTLKNKVVSMSGFAPLITYYNNYPVATAQTGQPIGTYLGYQVIGVFQNQAQVDADATAKNGGAQPGDFQFKEDANGNMQQVPLGTYLPKLTYGFNLGLEYKGLEFSVVLQGVSGNKIFDYRRTFIDQYGAINIDANLATNLWTGEGTSNSYPSAAGLNRTWNQHASSYYIENGSYIRIQNAQLAYTWQPKSKTGANMPSFRFSLTAQNPYTFLNKDYHGFNPDVTQGIDNQVYPMAATYTFGLRIIF